MFWHKIRPMVGLGMLVTGTLTFVFGMKLYSVVHAMLANDKIDEGTIALVLALAAGTFTPLGGLLALTGQVATDPEPNPIIEYEKVRQSRD